MVDGKGATMARVAALYVDLLAGPYARMPDVDPWGFASRDGSALSMFHQDRDARLYAGPLPVVAHPPCGPWGRFWWNYKGGEGDRSCGIRAAEQVRELGGILEHPEHSGLWDVAGLPRPEDGRDHLGGVYPEGPTVRLGPHGPEADVALYRRSRA